MNLVDSSGWLEYFADGPNADFFAPVIAKTRRLLVPTVSLYEVFKRILQQSSENVALQAIAGMQQGLVVELTVPIALSAARLSLQHGFPLADSVILATAHTHGAILWTQDADFEGMDGVEFVRRRG